MICAGNWKMNKSPAQARDFVGQLKSQLRKDEFEKVVLIPPALCLESVLNTGQGLGVGAQNCYWQTSGAFTGENSPQTLKEMGAKFCLVGHSERRQLFGETDEMFAKKIKVLQTQGLTPIFCIGEHLNEREEGETQKILKRQLQVGLSEAVKGHPLWIAYEPVWAIGTGKVATPDQVAEAHEFIRTWLKSNLPDQAEAPILYGGSVKANNAGELKLPNVNGFLIGGASLELDSFLGILRA